MKKGLLTIGMFLSLSLSINAQVDTLSEFFTGTPTLMGSTGGGTISGNNGYGDVAKMQLFDNTNGVTGGGTITGVAVWVGLKTDAGGSFDVAIWSDNNGTPSTTPVGTATISIAAVDTSSAGILGLAEGLKPYNAVATFSSAINIPTGNKFWAGLILPTTAGDSISVVQNTEGDYADSLHCGEIWNDATFNLVKTSWGLSGSIAFAIYPIVNFTSSNGLAENELNIASVYPNPAVDVLNFNLNGDATSIAILSLDGKVISSQEVTGTFAKVNVSNLTSGIYMYQVATTNGVVATNKFVKK